MTVKQKGPLGLIASLLVLTGIVAMIFSGGCPLFLVPMLWPFWSAVTIITGPPFLLGAVIFWLASKYGRLPANTSRPGYEEEEP